MSRSWKDLYLSETDLSFPARRGDIYRSHSCIRKLLNYKKVFSLLDEIIEYPNIKNHIEVIEKSPSLLVRRITQV